MSEVCELLLKVHDILDNVVFNSVSRQHHNVLALQFPFLHSVKDVIPPSEACLYGCISWSLAQAQQQSSLGLSQSFPYKRGGKASPWPGFHFAVQKRPLSGSSGASLAKRPHLDSRNETCPCGKKSAGVNVSASSAVARRKGDHWGQYSWVTVLSLPIIFFCRFSGWYVFPFYICA